MMNLNLELPELIKEIKNHNAKRICLQFPDGLKKESNSVVDLIKKKTDAEVFIWIGSCFGACDCPTNLKNLNIDLLVQFGHSEI